MSTCNCTHCQKSLDDGKFYILDFGAMLRLANGDARMADQSELPAMTFLTLGVHDHDLTNGTDGLYRVNIEDEIPAHSNQHEAYFCSKDCIKTWFAARVDQLKDLTS
jgi:hypothetical protein